VGTAALGCPVERSSAEIFNVTSYWKLVEPVWEKIDIDGPDIFLHTFHSCPRASALLFAAHFCQSEVCNGGFGQFFSNSTGVLGPEAAEGFREIGQIGIAAIVRSAMNLFGASYPRHRQRRQELLPHIVNAMDALDENFYGLIHTEAGGFGTAADLFADRVSQANEENAQACGKTLKEKPI
jgi:hypothetical protein